MAGNSFGKSFAIEDVEESSLSLSLNCFNWSTVTGLLLQTAFFNFSNLKNKSNSAYEDEVRAIK